MDMNLDEIDRRILRVLQRDASVSVDALADAVHLPRNACWRRVKNLESEGVISRRVALINPDAVDLGISVFVLVLSLIHI